MDQTLLQVMPWGLTVGQTVLIVLGVLVLIAIWAIVGIFLRLAAVIIRVGCALIFIAAFAFAVAMVFYNFTNR